MLQCMGPDLSPGMSLSLNVTWSVLDLVAAVFVSLGLDVTYCTHYHSFYNIHFLKKLLFVDIETDFGQCQFNGQGIYITWYIQLFIFFLFLYLFGNYSYLNEYFLILTFHFFHIKKGNRCTYFFPYLTGLYVYYFIISAYQD